MVTARALTAVEADAARTGLAEVLRDCVEGGASVGFMAPFPLAEALAFFDGVVTAVRAGETVLFAACEGGRVLGTVQLALPRMPNQLHRGDVRKLLVHRDARSRGLATALMAVLEAEARRRKLTLLTLDTATGSPAEDLYLRLGWSRTGVIPNYALYPDGRLCDTTIYWKAL